MPHGAFSVEMGTKSLLKRPIMTNGRAKVKKNIEMCKGIWEKLFPAMYETPLWSYEIRTWMDSAKWHTHKIKTYSRLFCNLKTLVL